MTKSEILHFEQELEKMLKQKGLIHENWNQARVALLKTFRELGVYRFIENPEAILSRFNSCRIAFVNQSVLDTYFAMYSSSLNIIFLNEKLAKKPLLTSSFIHELLHCLTSQTNIVVNKERSRDKMKYLEYSKVGLTNELYAQEIKPKRDLLSRNKDLDKFMNRSIYLGKEFDFDKIYSLYDGLNEGLTNVMHEIAIQKLRDYPLPLIGYKFESKVAAQFVAIFGEEMWQAFFANDISCIGKKLGVENERIKEIASYLDEAVSDYEDEIQNRYEQVKNEEELEKLEEYEDINSLYEYSNKKLMKAQLELLSLFERKMIRETYQYIKCFDNGNDLRKTLCEAYGAYGRLFCHISDDYETVNNVKFFDAYVKSVLRCEKFANCLLVKNHKSPMSKIHQVDLRYFSVEANEETYPILTANGKEISLKDHIYKERKLSQVKLTADYLDYASIIFNG